MNLFYKRVALKLVEIERRRSWLLERTGIKPSTWSSWEKNDRYPPADRAVAIAEALGMSVEYLVAGKETPFDFRGTSPIIADIAGQLLQMPESKLSEVLTVVNTLTMEES